MYWTPRMEVHRISSSGLAYIRFTAALLHVHKKALIKISSSKHDDNTTTYNMVSSRCFPSKPSLFKKATMVYRIFETSSIAAKTEEGMLVLCLGFAKIPSCDSIVHFVWQSRLWSRLILISHSLSPFVFRLWIQSAPEAESYAFSADINQLLSLSKYPLAKSFARFFFYVNFTLGLVLGSCSSRHLWPRRWSCALTSVACFSQHSHQHLLLQQRDFPSRAPLKRQWCIGQDPLPVAHR